MTQIYEHQTYESMNFQEQSAQNERQFQHHITSSTADSMDLDWRPTPVRQVSSTPILATENQENNFLVPPQTNSFQYQQHQQNMIPGIPSSSGTNEATPKVPFKADNSTERISVPPLKTTRLQATRYKTKNAIMSILKRGDVVIEFIKYKAKLNADRITDICWISSDGMRIILYQPDPGRGLPIADHAPELPNTSADCIFSYDNLPSKHWKKYVYAARFVGLVKSKTPKVTYYSNQAKCALMESMEDFEACFYEGSKVTKSPSEGIKVYDKHGRQLNVDKEKQQAQPLIDHQQTCMEHCKSICQALEFADQTGIHTCFPVVIGRRPNTELHSHQITTHRRDNSNVNMYSSTPKTQQSSSINFSISAVSSVHYESQLQQQKQQQLMASQQNVPIKRVNIPGIGMATEVK